MRVVLKYKSLEYPKFSIRNAALYAANAVRTEEKAGLIQYFHGILHSLLPLDIKEAICSDITNCITKKEDRHEKIMKFFKRSHSLMERHEDTKNPATLEHLCAQIVERIEADLAEEKGLFPFLRSPRSPRIVANEREAAIIAVDTKEQAVARSSALVAFRESVTPGEAALAISAEAATTPFFSVDMDNVAHILLNLSRDPLGMAVPPP